MASVEDIRFGYRFAFGCTAGQLQNEAPGDAFVGSEATPEQRSRLLAMDEQLPHHRAYRACRVPRLGAVWMPVQEGETEERGVLDGPPRDFTPDIEEYPAESMGPRVFECHLEGDVPHVCELTFGILSYRRREALLAAVAPVHGANRHPHGASELPGLDIVEALAREHRRCVPHVESHQHGWTEHRPTPTVRERIRVEGTFLPRLPVYRVGLT